MKVLKKYNDFVNEGKVNEGNVFTFAGKVYNTVVGGLSTFFKQKYQEISVMFKKLKPKYGEQSGFQLGVQLTKRGELQKYGIAIEDFSTEKPEEKLPYSDVLEAAKASDIVPLGWPGDPSVPNVNVRQLENLLVTSFYNKDPLLIWGAPGIGKTDIIRQVARKLGVGCVTMTLSSREPVDFIGMPEVENIGGAEMYYQLEPGQEERATYYRLPIFFPRSNKLAADYLEANVLPKADDEKGRAERERIIRTNTEGGRGGILFMDEINTASDQVMKTCLRLVLDRELDNYKLPTKWVIFAAANRPDTGEAPTATELLPALANRFEHCNLYPTSEEWVKWAINAKIKNPVDIESGIWDEGEAYVDPDIIAFISFKKDLFHSLNADASPKAWPSPRSWASTGKKLSAAKKSARREGRELDNDEIKLIAATYVGNAAAIDFAAFVELKKYFSAEDVEMVYKNPDKAKLPPKQGPNYKADTTYAIITAIAWAKKGMTISMDEFHNIIKYGIKLDQMEYATTLLKFVVRFHPYLRKDPGIHAAIKDWYAHYGQPEL